MASTSDIPKLQPANWSSEPAPLVGYLSRKALPIKRNDAEPLTREDVQFDLLYHIFNDRHKVFTPQAPSEDSKVHFCDLYVNALYTSHKCSKVLKDKMAETPAFAVELGKISLLTNVGRINTTMAFFPEMKTALRTYHPVPSLQKTDGNAQDAPRIKNCLKAALLPSELKNMPPSTPEEILHKSRARQLPSTSIVNLIFVLANHAAPLASTHFDPPVNFLDLFLPVNIASADRARAFLWLVFHYLEGPDQPNPYDDDYSRQNPGKVPWLRRLTDEEMAHENVDTPDEIEWGRAMSAQRNLFLQKLVNSIEKEKKTKAAASVSRLTEPTSGRPRPFRTQQEGTRDKPYIHYLPPAPQITHSATTRDLATVALVHLTEICCNMHGRSLLLPIPSHDSDEELHDEHVRLDYSRRVDVIARLRGRPPSPPADQVPPDSSTSSYPPPSSISDTREHRWRTVESWK
ncbi:uncharacterized protein EDB91DRAFT_1242285 [Suillus paluster]|uniref:uncharacterized protein n=1 Tax=Suillus paluster TaxID=48578 RepID=UPI001B87CBD9|nr:uncharacterized protein EDB91DRAFT_1242285 [Suillus paluster]KAG1755081.1 hypothetical protein EDB91DRAFT_1242285 [Suillus paluster]